MSDSTIVIQPEREASERQPTLDFLRGIAVIGVVTFHTLAIFNPEIPVLTAVLALGVHGVQLFFFVSALTMCYMWDRRSGESQPVLKFYIRRLFRIGPPFWLAMIGYLALFGAGPSYWTPDGIGFRHIAVVATFLHVFWPDTVNAIVPGGWSIGVEMVFYALFPFLFMRRETDPRIYLIAAFVLYGVNLAVIHPFYNGLLGDYVAQHEKLVGEFYYFEFFSQAPIFLIGIFLYKFLQSAERTAYVVFSLCLFSVWLMIAFILKYLTPVTGAPFFWLMVSTLMVGIAIAFKLRLSWAPINRLGQLSYSIYLIHFIVILGIEWCFKYYGLGRTGFVSFACAISLVMLASWISGIFSERLFEKPSVRTGQALIRSLKTHAAPALQP